MNKKQIFFFVDMDGVIADFMDGANALNMSAKEFKLKRGAFLNLKPIVNAFKVLDAIEEQLKKPTTNATLFR